MLALRPMIRAIGVAILGFGSAATADVSLHQDAGQLSWETKDQYESATLKISGPDGFSETRQFDAGQSLYFDFSAVEKSGWRDGAYSFELQLIPKALVSGRDLVLLNRLRELGQDTSFATPEPLSTSSGTFQITSGKISDPELEEYSAQKAQVIVTDLVVQGSGCLGFDCVNGESFGFDTLRLKENNLRIHFQDTSNSASFPSTDWRIVANDTSNGGSNYLAIEDADAGRQIFRVDAGAPANSLRVINSGNVGIGEANPVVELHVSDGDSPTMRLEQDGSSGFTPQTWDIAGNETNFFVRDATNGSSLPLRIRAGAPQNALYIDSDGDIGFGTDNPSSGSGATSLAEIKDASGSASLTLDYAGAGTFGEVTFEESNSARWSAGAVANSDFFYVYNYGRNANDLVLNNANGFLGLGGVTGPVNPIQHSNGAILTASGVWQDASSRSLKTNIQPISGAAAMATLQNLNPVSFRYLADPADEVMGFIAEEVPDMVATASRKTLSSMDIVAVLTKVVQEQQIAIDRLNDQIKQMSSPNNVP